eukprot:1853077-Rhodomonas_salina.1
MESEPFASLVEQRLAGPLTTFAGSTLDVRPPLPLSPTLPLSLPLLSSFSASARLASPQGAAASLPSLALNRGGGGSCGWTASTLLPTSSRRRTPSSRSTPTTRPPPRRSLPRPASPIPDAHGCVRVPVS